VRRSFIPKKVKALAARLGSICDNMSTYKSRKQMKDESCKKLVTRFACIFNETNGLADVEILGGEAIPSLRKNLRDAKNIVERWEKTSETNATPVIKSRLKNARKQVTIAKNAIENALIGKMFANVNTVMAEKGCIIDEVVKDEPDVARLFEGNKRG